MSKTELVAKFIAELEKELEILTHSANDAVQESNQDTDVPLSQSDHRALEAGMLASAQNERVKTAQKTIELIKSMPIKDFTKTDPIAPSALVELKHEGKKQSFFLAPQGAGTTVNFGGKEVELITPKSPLGEELIDKLEGEQAVIETPKGLQEYEIISVS